MNGYVLSVVGTILLCAVLTAILPDGKMAIVIKGVTKLACVISIISPILILLHKEKYAWTGKDNGRFFSETVIENDTDFIQYYSEKRIQETQSALECELKNKYNVSTQVTLSWQAVTETYANYYPWNKMQITQIYVQCEDLQSEEVKKNMWEYLTKNYCSEVLIE